MSKVPLTRIDPAGASNDDFIVRESGVWVPKSLGDMIPGGLTGEALVKLSPANGDWGWGSGGGGGTTGLTDFISPEGFRIVEEFFYFDRLKGLVPSTTSATNIRQINDGSNRPGIVGLDTASSVSTAIQIRAALGNTIGPVLAGNGTTWKCGWLVKTPSNLSDASNNYFCSAGFQKDFLNVDPMAGIMFYYNHASSSGNWTCQTRRVTAGANDSTIGDSTVAVAANTWYMLEIEIKDDATEVYFYVDGTLVHTATADIPTADTVGWGCAMQKFAGGSSRIFYIDMAYIQGTWSSDRAVLS